MTTTPVTGEIEARFRQIWYDTVADNDANGLKLEQEDEAIQCMMIAYSLDRASVDGVLGALATISTMTPNYLDGRFEDHASLVRRLKEVARAALSAVSIPRGKVVVTDELVAAIAQSYNSSVEGFGEKIYQGSLRNALEAALPLPPAGGWRDTVIEQIASWHDGCAKNCTNEKTASFHTGSAGIIRSLFKSPAPSRKR